MVDLEQFREAVKQAYGYYPVVVDGELHNQRDADRFAGFRLLSIIDNAGKVEAEPSAVRSLVAAANAVLALYPGDDLLWTLESAVRPFNATKPAECAKECPPQQVCDYCQIASNAHQPAPVVDDGGLSRSLKLAAAEEQAEAWQAVCSILNELRPNWAVGHGSGINLALNAIRSLSAPVVDDAMVDAAIAAQDAHWANDANYPTRAPRSAKGDADLHDKLARGAMRAALTAALSSVQALESP